MSFLELQHLRRSFANFVAVHDFDLSIEQGEFVSLLGPSGCGKTTTLQMLAGFLQPSAGQILLEKRDLVSIAPAKRGLGIVFQSYALFAHMTAAQNVAFGLEMRKVPKDERNRRVEEALSLVGLAAFAHRYPRQMSGGQQQRVALARAIVVKPSILLLDEPLSNLDAKLREEMQLELRQIQRNLGTTTILVTHDQTEAMALSDRIVVMNGGRIEQVGMPDEVYERPKTAFVANFLGKTNTLPGISSGGADATLRVGDASWQVGALPSGEVTVSVRPEKIAFVDKGLSGRLRTRVFQGSHWLCQVETAVGEITVIRQNIGASCPKEGASVALSWQTDDMLLSPASP